ncbi:hypothetical protein MP477_08460 [Chryseobacterium sp. WG23]|uniref:hypothetical protein n=1 Tax=Chryseobacterium sp. WG23 TaxID=2926910 RepID=UPI00211DE6FE|nr:hypothetical protein [Chryseobacterium sp. WG23]MCQ9634981.1 hypothetical protein [Chryseobacterium sp. WG23]
MELNKRNFIIFCILILSIIIAFLIIKYNRSEEMYITELNGRVESLRYVGRGEGYVEVKFEGDDKFNPLCVIYIGSENKEDLKVGDSIHKVKNSKNYQVYRQDTLGNFNFYKTLKSEP